MSLHPKFAATDRLQALQVSCHPVVSGLQVPCSHGVPDTEIFGFYNVTDIFCLLALCSRPAHEHAIQQQQQQQRLSNRRAAIGASTEAANAYDVDESDTQAAREPMSLASSPPRKHARMQARLSATSGMGMPADGLSTHCEADALGHMDSPPLLTAGIVSLELEAKGSEDEESQGHELKPAVHRAATLALWEEQVATLQSAQVGRRGMNSSFFIRTFSLCCLAVHSARPVG